MLYRRVLLKISGELLAGVNSFGFNAQQLQKIARQIAHLAEQKLEVGIVIGGGNLLRGRQMIDLGVNNVAADQMGMLATAINGIALRDALEKFNMRCRLSSAFSVEGILEKDNPYKIIRYLEDGDTIIYCGGLGNPFFTTDTAACLRAVEIRADILLKGTKVNGVYDKDPTVHPDAKKYSSLGYNEAISKNLHVMDLTAISLAKDHNLPLRVFNIMEEDNLLRAISDEKIGTLIQ